jgi:hypothetical protein
MLNPITFKVEQGSGPLTVTANGSDYAAYEDAFDRPAIKGIAEGRYKCWAFIVWHAMHRQEFTTLTFEEFLASTPDFGSPQKADEILPLESKAPTGE